MAAKESQLVLSLTDGITETVAEEIAGGIITRSDNTRLTRTKGTLSKAPAIEPVASFGALECGGLVTNGKDSTVAYFRAGEANTARWSNGHLGQVKGVDGTPGQNAYYPYPLTNSGAVPGGLTTADPVVCVDASGLAWHFSVRAYSTTQWAVYATVLDGERIAVSPQLVALVAGSAAWIGATATVLNVGGGITCWYQSAGAQVTSQFLRIDTDGMSLISGGAVNRFTLLPASPTADVTSNGTDAFAFVVFCGTATDLTVQRFDLQAGTSTSATIPGVRTAGEVEHVAVCLHTRSSVEYLTVAYSDWTLFTGLRHYTAASLTMLWQRNNQMQFGRVGVQPFVRGASAYMVVACDNFFTGALGTDSARVTFGLFDMATGAAVTTPAAYWYKLQARGGYRKVSDTAIYPFFPCCPSNRTDKILDTDVGFMTDPSIEIWTLFDSATATPVMRCGVDRIAPFLTHNVWMNSGGTFVAGNKLYLTYKEQKSLDKPVGTTTGYSTRFCVFDLAPAIAPAYAFDERGSTAIASGLPAYWDGTETAEYGPLHAPYLEVQPAGGTWSVNLTGTYAFTAVASWRDANGLVRRSAPAVPVVVTLAGSKPHVYVTNRASMRNGVRQEEVDIVLYATLVGGSTFFAQGLTPTKGVQGCWHFPAIPEPSAENTRLYSTGADNEPLTPQHPPPASSVAVVGARMWLINAENPYEIWPSKLKEPTVAYEFAGELALTLPPAYGKALAILSINSAPYVFCERGVLMIAGYGPDNSGQTGSFGDPIVVSTLGCRARETVAQIPGDGAIYQSATGRFARVGGTAMSFDTFGFYDVGSPVVFPRTNEVAYPLTNGAGWVAYNYLADAWTKWTPNVSGAAITALAVTAADDGTNTTLLYAASTGTFATMDSESYTSGYIAAERGWIAPESPQGDCVVREIWVHAINSGTHGVLVTVFFDYDDTNFVQQAWTATEIADLTVNGRYTLGVNCEATQARAVKVRVEEVDAVTGLAMQPLTLLVTYGADPGVRRRTLKEGALK